MSSNADLGPRERKRLATRRAIQHAVLTLVIERGIENVTVEDVSRVAEVSPRTFFNYFSTKDEAIIGDLPFAPDAELIDAFVDAGPDSEILADLGLLLAQAAVEMSDDHEIHLLRKQVLTANPNLLGVRIASMRTFEEALYQIVERRVNADDPSLAGDHDQVFHRAWMVTLVALAALRHAWRCWADAPTPDALSDRIRQSFDEVFTVVSKTR